MNIKISLYKENASIEDDNLVSPDVVQNRFGTVYGAYTMLLLERDSGEKFYIPFHQDANKGYIGIVLTPLEKDEIKSLAKYIFSNYKSVKQLSCEYSLQKISGFTRNYPTNQFHLVLPETKEVLWERMSSKSKQTLRRKHNHLFNQFESEPEFLHYTMAQGIPDEIVEAFFSFKKSLMDREYGLTAQEYLRQYFVTDAYVWKIATSSNDSKEKYLSMVFTCEQGQNVYLENLSYNPSYQKESPGFLLYSKVVEELIQKGKKEFFLGRKYRDYKQKFDSINTLCFDSIIFRSFPVYLVFICKKAIKKIVRS